MCAGSHSRNSAQMGAKKIQGRDFRSILGMTMECCVIWPPAFYAGKIKNTQGICSQTWHKVDSQRGKRESPSGLRSPQRLHFQPLEYGPFPSVSCTQGQGQEVQLTLYQQNRTFFSCIRVAIGMKKCCPSCQSRLLDWAQLLLTIFGSQVAWRASRNH